MISPFLPDNAPFTPEQRSWLNGFLAGMQNLQWMQPGAANGAAVESAGSNGYAPMEAAPEKPAAEILLLYGSQSGNTEGLAHQCSDFLLSLDGPVALKPKVVGMDAYTDLDLSSYSLIALLCSTWGDGDMPDHAVAFWDFLQSDKAPRLETTSFAVLGLGDKSYKRFCQSGKNLDGRFETLGAKRLMPLVTCDTDFEATFKTWSGDLGKALMLAAGSLAGVDPSSVTATAVASPSPATLPLPKTSAPGESSGFNRKNPFPAALLENHPLNAKGSAKDTRHINLSLLGSGLDYKVGDALGVVPRNDYDLVDRIILRLNAFGSEAVEINGETATLRQTLLEKLDLRRSTDALLSALVDGTPNPAERKRLEALLQQPDSETTSEYLTNRDVLDVLEDFSQSRPAPEKVVAALGKLAPRLYSIASSPLENPGEVHLCIGIQRMMHRARLRRGVTSTYLAERVPLGMPVPVYLQPTSHFTVPAEPGTPIIMVGPGTGVAPFRAFLQERRALGDKGRNWLFFGDQCRAYDFLYSEEFVAMATDGFLNQLSLAFSRDQEQKVYVQNRMLESGSDLYAWLEEGAYFYVCGDAKRMAKDVDSALHQVIETFGGKTPDQARDYVERLKKEKRYARDVY